MANFPTRLAAQIVRTPIVQGVNSARRIRWNFNLLTDIINALTASGILYQTSPGQYALAANQVFFENGIPPNTIGRIGDYYVDLLTGNVYQDEQVPMMSMQGSRPPYQAAAPQTVTWSLLANLVYFKNGIPPNTIGSTGNYYVDMLSGNVYEDS